MDLGSPPCPHRLPRDSQSVCLEQRRERSGREPGRAKRTAQPISVLSTRGPECSSPGSSQKDSAVPGGSAVKGLPARVNPPEMQRRRDRSRGREDPLGKEMATRSTICAWEIPWTEALPGLLDWGCKGSGATERSLLSSTTLRF